MKNFGFSIAALVASMSTAMAGDWVYPEIDPESGENLWAEHYPTCGSGTEQSPIDIIPSATNILSLKDLKLKYDSAPLNVVNNGHTIQVNFAPGSELKVKNETYHLLQFHFHAHSENTVDGQPYPMEAHFVHMNSEGDLAVLGLFVEEGHEENKVLGKILDVAPSEEGEAELESSFTADELAETDRVTEYYHFMGSLTTPPCSEGVKWFVAKEPVHASHEQLHDFEALMHHGTNYRDTQPLNLRTVLENQAD